MARARPRGRRRVLAALCVVVLAGCASPAPSIAPAGSPGQPQPSTGTGPSSPAAATTAPASASPSGVPSADDPLPQDIVGGIDAIVDAPTLEQAMAATRIVLERSGVVVTDDPASAPPSPAGIYVGTDQLATMAHEAQSRAGLSHVTFAEFAVTFGGLALLPPNDGLLARLPEPGATPDPGTDLTTELKLDQQPLRLAAVVTSWVNRSLDSYPGEDPIVTALTAPAIYLAELARRQNDPIDLRQPFNPTHLELGSLDVTLLIAGLRTAIRAAAPASTLGSRFVLARSTVGDGTPRAIGDVDLPACEELRRLIDARVPLLTEVYAFTGNEVIKSLGEAVIKDIFESAPLSKAFAPVFEALGVLFRVQALWMLFRHTEVTLEIEPAALHKSTGVNAPAAAMLVAGISDAEWEKAKKDRDSSPFAAQLKACARAMGIPVTTDLVDVGDATSTWRVAWELRDGAAHAQFEGCQFIPSCDRNAVAAGRLERSLSKRSDHSAQDTVILEIKPEKETDHPGEEKTAPVRVCAHVRTDKPPDLGTFLNVGTVGTFGPGGIASLASSVSNILLGWWQFVFTLDACAKTDVSFHVPLPGDWKGTIKINFEFQESSTITTKSAVYTHRRSTDITDTFYVGGSDKGSDGSGAGIRLDARQYTQGGDVVLDTQDAVFSNASGCRYTSAWTWDAGGSWNFDADAQVWIVLKPDGQYQLVIGTGSPPEEILLPGTDTKVLTDNGSVYECQGFGTFTSDSPLTPNGIVATGNGGLIEGRLDPANPGSELKGRMSFRDSNDLRYVITMEWQLTRVSGPIVLPVRPPG